MIKDRMTRGIIAGAVGAIVQNIYGYLAQMLGFTSVVYLDISRATLFLNNYKGLYATIVGIFGHFATDIIGGIVFAYLIKATSSRYFLLKGISFGILMWFIIRLTGTTLLRIPIFIHATTKIEFVFLIGALLFGLTLAYTLKLLAVREEKI